MPHEPILIYFFFASESPIYKVGDIICIMKTWPKSKHYSHIKNTITHTKWKETLKRPNAKQMKLVQK